MRLMILWPDRQAACQIRDRMENEGWYVEMLSDSRSLLPWNGEFDVLLMHLCLPGADGLTAGQALADSRPVCPPRILFAAPSEWCVRRPSWADCMICTGADTAAICTLIRILAHKPLPAGAMAAPIFWESFTPRSTIRPGVAPEICAITDSFLKAAFPAATTTAPHPVTVHVAEGGLWFPYANGNRNCFSAVAK